MTMLNFCCARIFSSVRCLFWLFAVAALLGSFSPTVAQSPTPAVTPGQPLRVATRVVPPMVMKDDKGQLTGFSIDLWTAIARDLNLSYQMREIVTLPDLLGSVRDRSADLAIAAISITAEREQEFDFSQPILDAGLQIMVRADRGGPPPLYATLWNLMTSGPMRDLFLLMVVLVILPVPIIWLLERRDPDSLAHGRTPVAQVGNSLWWSVTAIAGQAKDSPRSLLGRVLAVLWMFTGVVFISYFTATVTASLTVKQLDSAISKLEDLPGKRVGTVRASSTDNFLKAQRVDTIGFTQISEALAALQADRLDAVVFDAPVLNYYAAREGRGKVIIVGAVLKPESYGILFADDSPTRKAVNQSLLRLKENGEHEAIRRKWFGGAETGAGS